MIVIIVTKFYRSNRSSKNLKVQAFHFQIVIVCFHLPKRLHCFKINKLATQHDNSKVGNNKTFYCQ